MGQSIEKADLTNFTEQPRRKRSQPIRTRNSALYQDQVARGDANIFRSVWESSAEGLRLTDENGIILSVNRAFAKMFDVDPESCIGKPCTWLYEGKEQCKGLAEILREPIESKRLEPLLEGEILKRGWSMPGVELVNYLVRSDDDRNLVLTQFRWASTRSGGAEVLQDLASIVRHSSDAIFSVNLQGVVLTWNPSSEIIFGRCAAEACGTRMVELFCDATNHHIRAMIEHALHGQPVENCEIEYHMGGGEVMMLELTVSALKNLQNIQSGWSVVARNITERKRSQLERTESEQRFRLLFENAVQPMFQTSLEGRILCVNMAFLRLLGYRSLDEVAHLNIGNDIYADPGEREMYRNVLHEKGCLNNIELRLKRKNGRIVTVLEHARALRDAHGRITGYEGTLEDITFRKALEEKLNEYVSKLEQSKQDLQDLNAQKDKLFSILSHDLRSPFASILGFCDILMNDREQLTNDEKTQFLRFIREAATDQLRLVNKLLDWSRLESGRIKVEMKELNLSTLVSRCIQSLGGLSKQKSITIQSTLPDEVLIRGDEQLVLQVFGNLIGNSLKFTPDNGSIAVELVGRRKGQWHIGVRDTGVGMKESDLTKLFKIEEKFTRKGLRGERGTGLGLPVCQEIMQKHSGDITVESRQGVGTTFLLTFPDASGKPENTILVVDDENGVRILHTRFIKRALPNSRIIYASDGVEALAAAKKFNPVLIVTDYDMPVMNGLEFLSKLKGEDSTKDTPVIVITGQDSHASLDQLTTGGAIRILTKPVASEQLVDAVKASLQTSWPDAKPQT
jgi:PAS domain S-box-containing protein